MPRTKKPKTVSQELDHLAVRMQLLVRMKGADYNGFVSCVTCGVTRHYKDGMQGGHFIPRKFVATKVMEKNIHPQCAKCNGPLRGNMIMYTLFMEDMYGREFIDELHDLARNSKRWTREEIAELLEDVNRQIKELEGSIC